ncbi:MAG: transglutaminase protein [Gemmatimonadetes bacterium]|nr:transglutaminase protein [Gemmatimonadota bacterium]
MPPLATLPVPPATLAATPILDHGHAAIRRLAEQARAEAATDAAFLRAVHGAIAAAVRPVYTLDDRLPASAVLGRGTGSCSQRMGCLEAAARGGGVPTRVRGLWVSGRFWYPRFRLARPFIPARVLLAWPQFHVDGAWTDFDELYAPVAELAARDPAAAYHNDGETLFEAVSHTPVDLLGKTRECGAACATGPAADLSRFILHDAGFFDTRDALFARFRPLLHSIRGRFFEAVFGGRKSA